MIELRMQNGCADFVAHFMKETEGLTPTGMAVACWSLANRQWSAGYRQGKDDPDFDRAGKE